MTATEVPPAGTALGPAAVLLQQACATEETRFSNLNGRAIALVSASSLVTALIGFFAKDLLTDTFDDVRKPVAVLTAVTLLALLVSTGILLKGVLIPGGRLTFGDNPVTAEKSTLISEEEVRRIQWSEFRQVLERLIERNDAKASAMNIAYYAYGVAVLSGMAAVGVVLSQSWR